MRKTIEVLQACLLYDVVRLFRMARYEIGQSDQYGPSCFGGQLPQCVIEAIQYPGEMGMPEKQRDDHSLAHIVNAARRIAYGLECSSADIPISLLKNSQGLESIFNHLNQRDGHARFRIESPEGDFQYPSESAKSNGVDCYTVIERWRKELSPTLLEPAYANALLESFEPAFSYVPAPCYGDSRQDVSLFHHCKAIAAIGCSLERWLNGKGITNYREALLTDGVLKEAEPFVLFSMDLSGIQSFIYTISSKGALKGLRVRSFYLSMLMEHIADSILEACRLTRANLIYSGGGRAHLLLPNDGICLAHATEVVNTANAFLRGRFGASLFLAYGCASASAAQLSSSDNASGAFSDLFRAASRCISTQKLQRYSAAELLELNRRDENQSSDRECAVCGRSGRLQPHEDSEMVCETCGRLERFSNTLAENNLLLAVTTTECANSIPLPGEMWLTRTDTTSLPDSAARIYCVNSQASSLPNCVYLHIGNYRASNEDGSAMTFEQLADASTGIERLGVLRADVDNLGALFASGFVAPKESNPHRYEILPRYMALSGAMTAFFQREINRVIGLGGTSWIPDAEASSRRHVSIVYSGGDDVFLVGAWNEVLDAGLALQDSFARYTGGSVTLSAGLGLFTPHEPVGVMGAITAEMEEDAKLFKGGEKNALALFAPASHVNSESTFVFHWDTLRNDIIGEKLRTLHDVFFECFSGDQDIGNAFLYQILALLRDMSGSPIAIARLAYLLARHAPDKKHNPEERARKYDAFSRSVYHWALDKDDNQALQAAILLHVYSHRRERNSDV